VLAAAGIEDAGEAANERVEATEAASPTRRGHRSRTDGVGVVRAVMGKKSEGRSRPLPTDGRVGSSGEGTRRARDGGFAWSGGTGLVAWRSGQASRGHSWRPSSGRCTAHSSMSSLLRL
jgi:hypothetical protein